MDLPEAAPEIILGLLLALVRGAQLADEGGVIREAGDIHAEERPVADPRHRPETDYLIEAVKISGEKPELTRRVIEAYRERFAFLGLWS